MFLNQITLVELVVEEEEDKVQVETRLPMELQEQLTQVVALDLVVKQVELEQREDQELLFLEDQVELHLVLIQDQLLQCQLTLVEIK